MKATTLLVSETQKRSVKCPRCYAASGRACTSAKIPSQNTLGGGWGGYPALDRSHPERRDAYLGTVKP